MIVDKDGNRTGILPSELKTLLSSVTLRVDMLLMPIVDGLSPDLSPTDADCRAAITTMSLCDSLLRGLLKESDLRHLKSKEWLNDSDWREFSLRLDDAISKLSTHCDYDVMAPALKLKATVDNIIPLVRRHPFNSKLFITKAMERLYAGAILLMNDRFVKGQQLKHKDLMVVYAMMYEVVRQNCGLGRAFYGPDFDKLLYDVCGIKYNGSNDRKGRYRQVGDVWKKLFGDSDENSAANNETLMKMKGITAKYLFGREAHRRFAFLPKSQV